MGSALLTDRTVLRVTGGDAAHFLQNLVTCDVEGLAEGGLSFGALLTPQGKILFEFFLARTGANAFLLDTDSAHAADLLRRLTFYKLRADVTIEATDLPVSAAWGADARSGDDRGQNDPRLSGFAQRSFEATGGCDDYDAHRIATGLPAMGRDFEPETTFPHEALFDQFERGGVDFQKGCYVGQEVVSRMQHRGTARSRFVKVTGTGLPASGTPVTAGGRAVGTMGSSAGRDGLALVRLDRAAKAMDAGMDLMAGEAVVAPQLPSFVSFDWPAQDTGDHG